MAELTSVNVTLSLLWVDFVELAIELELPQEEISEFNTYFLAMIKSHLIENEEILNAITNIIAIKCYEQWIDVDKETLSDKDKEIVNTITTEVWQSISISSMS